MSDKRYVIDVTIREVDEAMPAKMNMYGKVETAGRDRKVKEVLHIVTSEDDKGDAITHAIALLNVEMGRERQEIK